MRKLVYILLLLAFSSCSRYHKGQEVTIKLGGSKGTIVLVQWDNKYHVRYLDRNGVYQVGKFEESEIEFYMEPENIQNNDSTSTRSTDESEGDSMEERQVGGKADNTF